MSSPFIQNLPVAAKRKSKKQRQQAPKAKPTVASAKRRVPVPVLLVLVACLVVTVALSLYSSRNNPNSSPTEKSESSGKTMVADDSPVIDDSGEPAARLPIDTAATWKQLDDPTKDGWRTESLSDDVNDQLKQLAKLLSSTQEIQPSAVSNFAGSDFACGDLRPRSLTTIFSDAIVRVDRPDAQAEPSQDLADDSKRFRGLDGFVEVLRAIRQPFPGPLRVKFKLFRIRVDRDIVTTQQFFSLAGHVSPDATGEEEWVEENTQWETQWRLPGNAAKPELIHITATNYERVTVATTPIFGDATESVLGANPSYSEQILYGYGYWLERLQDKRAYSLFSTPALALGDVNGDGLDDLYVGQEGGLPNLLYLHQSDGTAKDISADAGANWLESSRGALILDFDNDGDQDLAVAITANIILAENDGAGHFTVRAVLSTTRSTFSLAAADYDQDGDLDLFVCGYFPTEVTESSGSLAVAGGSEDFVFHDANVAAPNSFFRNDWSEQQPWQFSDVTAEVGLDENNRRFSFAAQWEDFDNDGDQDLYVANDFGRNNLYRNDDGHFVDIAAAADVEDSASGMGVTWADFDHDGWMDLYVSNMYSAAGNRVAVQTAFKTDSKDRVRKRVLRFARGNSLFKNRGDGTFSDVSKPANVTMGRWAWGSNFFDLNNDGWDDLVVANGYITGSDSSDL